MGVGAGLYMYVVVVQKFTFAISSPDEFLVNWAKTKIKTTAASFLPGILVPVARNNVEIIESFAYLGVNIHNRLLAPDNAIWRNVSLFAITWMASLYRNIMAVLNFGNKLRYDFNSVMESSLAYTRYPLWSWNMVPMQESMRNLDAFDQRCMCRSLRVVW